MLTPKHLPVEHVSALRQALLGMRDDTEAVPVLKETNCQGFDAADERDYDNVRRIYRAIGK